MSVDIKMMIGAPRYPVLNSFMACRERVSFIQGPLGSGKTYGLVQRLLAHMVEQAPNAQGIRPTRWLAIRNTYPELIATTARDFQAIFEGLGEMRLGGLEPPTYRVHFALPDETRVESEVTFLALDRDDAIRKLRGYQVTGVWLSEAKELHKAVIDMADLRHGRYPTLADGGVECTWHGMLGDTNAPDVDHWLYKLAEEERPEGWAFFRQPGGVIRAGTTSQGAVDWQPNPDAENLANLPEGYYVRGMAGKRDDWIAANLANEYGFVADGKPVHPEYVDATHCAKDELTASDHLQLVLGFDFGRTPACVVLQHHRAADRFVVLDEFYDDSASAALFAPALRRYLAAHYPAHAEGMLIGWGDPAGDHAGQATEDTPLTILQAHGIPCEPAPSNEPLLRRAALANPLTRLSLDGRPAFVLSPRCKRLRRALQGGFCYRRANVSGERYADVPDKNLYSHVAEALEYALLGLGEGRDALHRSVSREVHWMREERLPETAILYEHEAPRYDRR
jgi:hypothetical protein